MSGLHINGNGSHAFLRHEQDLPRLFLPPLLVVLKLKHFVPAPVCGNVRAHRISLYLKRTVEVLRSRIAEPKMHEAEQDEVTRLPAATAARRGIKPRRRGVRLNAGLGRSMMLRL